MAKLNLPYLVKSPTDCEDDSKVLWERSEKNRAVAPLSREIITRAAVALADEHGLTAVSLRRVAAAIGVSTMRLYAHLSAKEDLLELMVDSMYGGLISEGAQGENWQQALRGAAGRLREIALAHRWLVELLGGRPHLGPNAIAHLEALYAALSKEKRFGTMDALMQAVATVNAYVLGAIRSEVSDLHLERGSGSEREEWEAKWWPYLQRVIATGRFPMMGRIVNEATHPTGKARFEQGLDCVLAGIEETLLK